MLSVRRATLLALLAAVLSPALAPAQSLEETWLKFLDEEKTVDIRGLSRPHPTADAADYAKYLLMKMNSAFCQSDLAGAEDFRARLDEIDGPVRASVDGLEARYKGVRERVAAYHRVDELWDEFVRTGVSPAAELERVEGMGLMCERGTLAKYSYMMSAARFCGGDVAGARELFEDRTLRLASATSWRFDDVAGMAPRVERMQAVYAALPMLERDWRTFVKTGESPGFSREFPVVACNPELSVRAAILRGMADVCGAGAEALESIETWQAAAAVSLPPEVDAQLIGLEEAVAAQQTAISNLEAAWSAFLEQGKVDYSKPYGYDYCATEPLIRAYLLDGFGYVCELGESSLAAIDSLQRVRRLRLAPAVKEKLSELRALRKTYNENGRTIEAVWDDFLADGDTLLVDYVSTDEYCDQIQQVKDWTIRGLMGDCDEAVAYLNAIEEFNARFDFVFYEDLECRVQNLRARVWRCRWGLLDELARLEADGGEAVDYATRMEELAGEYGLGEEVGACEE